MNASAAVSRGQAEVLRCQSELSLPRLLAGFCSHGSEAYGLLSRPDWPLVFGVLRHMTVGAGAGVSDGDRESHFYGSSDSGVYAGLGSV